MNEGGPTITVGAPYRHTINGDNREMTSADVKDMMKVVLRAGVGPLGLGSASEDEKTNFSRVGWFISWQRTMVPPTIALRSDDSFKCGTLPVGHAIVRA